MSFIIRTERGCGKRALDSSGSVWILLSGESLNGGGVFFFLFFFFNSGMSNSSRCHFVPQFLLAWLRHKRTQKKKNKEKRFTSFI